MQQKINIRSPSLQVILGTMEYGKNDTNKKNIPVHTVCKTQPLAFKCDRRGDSDFFFLVGVLIQMHTAGHS